MWKDLFASMPFHFTLIKQAQTNSYSAIVGSTAASYARVCVSEFTNTSNDTSLKRMFSWGTIGVVHIPVDVAVVVDVVVAVVVVGDSVGEMVGCCEGELVDGNVGA